MDLNPILYNSAYAGFFEGKARLGVSYRNQWASVSRPFQTFAATGELALSRNRYRHNGFNAAMLFYRDQAGTLSYGTTAANIIVSYYQSPTGTNDNYLSGALEAGYGYAGFEAGAAEMTDPSESFAKDHTGFLTVGIGLAWFYQPHDLWTIRVAVSARNINQPNVSYMGLDDTRLSAKWNFYGRAEWRCSEYLGIEPLLAVQLQKNYHEEYLGATARWYIRDNEERIAPYGSILLRRGDAIVFVLGIDYNALSVGVSYDANISKLSSASRSFGALELGVAYRILSPRKKVSSLPCPIM